jgi:hypothetical protein
MGRWSIKAKGLIKAVVKGDAIDGLLGASKRKPHCCPYDRELERNAEVWKDQKYLWNLS